MAGAHVDNGKATRPAGASTKPAASVDQPKGGWGQVLDWVVKLIPATAGAIGLVGFVGATGAALTWWRFWTAGLPANQALKAVPVDERVITGVGALILFLILGAVATAAVYTLDSPGRPTGPMRHGLGALIVVEVLVAIWATVVLNGRTTGEAVVASLIVIAWGAVGTLMTYDPSNPEGTGTWKDPYRLTRPNSRVTEVRDALTLPLRWALAPFVVWLADGRSDDGKADKRFRERVKDSAQDKEETFCPVRPDAERLPLTDDELERWRIAQRSSSSMAKGPAFATNPTNPDQPDEARKRKAPRPLPWHPEQPFRWLRRISPFGFICAGLASATTVVLLYCATGDRVILGCFLVACALAVLIFGVCRATQTFWPYGLSVFLSVALFGTFVQAELLGHQPQGQAVAVIRKANATAVSGLYVADGKDGLWLVPAPASPHARCDSTPARGSASIVVVPRDEIAHYAIGGLRNICDAVKQERGLLRDLMRVFPPKPTNRNAPTVAK